MGQKGTPKKPWCFAVVMANRNFLRN